jgi:dipeptidyl aminopeptidase/acylaminoacyl peptidase
MDGLVEGPAFSDRGTVVFGYSSPTKAPDVWLWDWRKPELRRLTNTIYAGIDPKLFRDPQLVKIKSFDGLEVPAFMYLPPGYQPGMKVPFIMDMHGGPESQFRPAFIRNFQYFMLNGYGILAPNIRGSSGYGKEYLGLDNYKLRMNSVKDAGAYARWLIDQGYTTREGLGIRGGSYGGFMVLACITEFPDLFAAAVDEVGIANFETFLQNTAEYRRALREAEYGPLSDPGFLKSVSPIYKVDKIRTPLFVVHGENDPRVPVGEARQIAAAIATRGGVVDTLIFPDEGHGAAKRPNVLTEYRRQVEFFDKHLKK